MTTAPTRVETWWFRCFPRDIPSEGDELIVVRGSSIGTLWVMRTNVPKKFRLTRLDEDRYAADLISLAGKEAFPIEQGGRSVRKLPPEAKILLVTEVTRSGFYVEVSY